jgi:hypothetical protein
MARDTPATRATSALAARRLGLKASRTEGKEMRQQSSERAGHDCRWTAIIDEGRMTPSSRSGQPEVSR